MQTLRWRIGDVEIIQIFEVDAGPIIEDILPQATPQKIKEITWLYPHFADEEGRLKAVVQAFVVITPNHRIIVDTCVGNHKPRGHTPLWNMMKTDFLARLESAGCAPETIDTVLCTHLHYDHIGWNTMLRDGRWVPTFPNAKYLFSEKEYEYWRTHPKKEAIDDHYGFADSVTPVVEAGLAELVGLDYVIGEHVSLIPTPGHTPGHVCVLVSSRGAQAVITGDAMHHPCQIAHPDWSAEGDSDQDRAKQSREALFERFAGTKTLIIGSHFAAPTAGKLERHGNGFKFIV